MQNDFQTFALMLSTKNYYATKMVTGLEMTILRGAQLSLKIHIMVSEFACGKQIHNHSLGKWKRIRWFCCKQMTGKLQCKLYHFGRKQKRYQRQHQLWSRQVLPKQHCSYLGCSHKQIPSLHFHKVHTSTSPLPYYAPCLERSSISGKSHRFMRLMVSVSKQHLIFSCGSIMTSVHACHPMNRWHVERCTYTVYPSKRPHKALKCYKVRPQAFAPVVSIKA